MERPLFSIITCTYNSARFIRSNIESVQKQLFRDFEHVFIDGFSQDGTVKLIKQYQEENPGKVYFYQVEAQGIAHAMNEGVKQARGTYIIHLHSDDSFYDEQVLQDAHLFLAQNPHLDWIYGQIDISEEDGSYVGLFPKRWIWQQAWGYLLKFYNFIGHQAVFIKKDIFAEFGYFDTGLKNHMDYDLWLRIYQKTEWEFFDRIIANRMFRADAQSSGEKYRKENTREANFLMKRHLNLLEYLVFRFNFLLFRKFKKIL